MTADEAKSYLRAAKRLDNTRQFWRTHVAQAWMDGNYRRHGLEEVSAELQQKRIRNKFGSTWLTKVKGI